MARKTSSKKRPAKELAAKKPTAKRRASRLRAVSDELGLTMPRSVRRTSAGKKKAPRARPRVVR